MKTIEHKITDEELLDTLLDETRYLIDCEKGEIYSVYSGKPLYRMNPAKFAGKTNRDCIRIIIGRRRRSVTVAKAIWMASRRTTVPPGCDVHHANEYSDDNHWENLVCIHEYDHRMVHKLLSGDAPF